MQNINSVAYIGKIVSISDIPGADFIQLATVDGWSSVIKKDQFKVGDLVAIFTNDAVIPHELAVKTGVITYLRNNSRVRTVKLKGVYSECLLIDPMQLYGNGIFPVFMGQDLQDKLNVFKYEPPAKWVQGTGGKGRYVQPNRNFEVYYKFPNAKNVKGMFSEYDLVVYTRKLHGTNFRAGIVKKNKLSFIDRIFLAFGREWAGYEFVFGSHNVQGNESSGGPYLKTVKQYAINEKLWNYCKNRVNSKDIGSGIVIYGEIIGSDIQEDWYTYGCKNETVLRLFDISVNGKYLPHFDFEYITGLLGLEMVDILHTGLFDERLIEEFNTHTFTINGKQIPHEGVVVKSIDGKRQKIAKFINNDYLTFAEKKAVPDSH